MSICCVRVLTFLFSASFSRVLASVFPSIAFHLLRCLSPSLPASCIGPDSAVFHRLITEPASQINYCWPCSVHTSDTQTHTHSAQRAEEAIQTLNTFRRLSWTRRHPLLFHLETLNDDSTLKPLKRHRLQMFPVAPAESDSRRWFRDLICQQ